MVSLVHQWGPDEWEEFSHSLLQSRHGVLNIHKVPANHSGDLGIDYYCLTDLVIYQCYAPEEPLDIAVRADRQKTKMTTDLGKLVKGAADISKLMLGQKLKTWVLLVPQHDSRELNLHCAKKTGDMRKLKLSILDENFEVCIQDQTHFPGKAVQDAMAGLTNLSLSVSTPSKKELENWEAGSADLVANATVKLAKRVSGPALGDVVAHGVEAFLRGNALIEALRNNAPDMHEKVTAAIQVRARTLTFAGPQGGTLPSSIMNTEIASLTQAIKAAAPTLSDGNALEIALGTISEWIMRCPLDFPDAA
ncbi:hypothetical protein EOE18_17685 [Novosphingobium umbonatum]|uniref:Uncharacterized protein n=1 Tax=Novosphingobium umbonatum TaxID=1908524 RepID=A0A437MX64_9SPHN|nr:hypothetical protein EOE18_17685 [Novosphingobium umbonatum]